MLHYVYSRIEFLCYSGPVSGQELLHFSVDKLETFLKLISIEVSDHIPNILWICFPVFALWDLERLGSIIFLTPLKTLILGIIHRLFLKTLKTTYFSTCVPKFLFRGSQIFCLLTFKIRLSLGLSCLMLPMLKILSN